MDPFLQIQTPASAQRLLADRVKGIRVGLGLKQTTLAARSGVALATLRRFASRRLGLAVDGPIVPPLRNRSGHRLAAAAPGAFGRTNHGCADVSSTSEDRAGRRVAQPPRSRKKRPADLQRRIGGSPARI